MMPMRYAGLITGVLLLGCGARHSGVGQGGADDDTAASAESGGADSAPGGGAEGGSSAGTGAMPEGPAPASPGELLIPMQPRSEGSLYALGMELDAGGTLVADTELTLALGEGYPERFVAELGEIWILPPCGALSVAGAATITSVSSARPGIEALGTADHALELELAHPGDYAIVVRGQLSADDWGSCAELLSARPSVDYELNLTVRVRRVAGAALRWPYGCEEPVHLLAGRAFGVDPLGTPLYLEPLDEQGEAFHPWNAANGRPVSVRVLATHETSLTLRDEERGLASLVADGPEQRIAIHDEHGEIAAFWLVGPEQIDAMDVRFAIEGIGKIAPELVSGERYERPWSLLDSAWIGAWPLRLGVRNNAVCSLPGAELFTLRSQTPATCPVSAEPGWSGISNPDTVLASANVAGAGLCELVLQAPSFNQGNGLTANLSVELVESP